MIKCFEETEMSQRIYFMLFNSWSISVLDLKVSVVSTSSTLLYYLRLFLKDKHQPFSKQNYLPKKKKLLEHALVATWLWSLSQLFFHTWKFWPISGTKFVDRTRILVLPNLCRQNKVAFRHSMRMNFIPKVEYSIIPMSQQHYT